MPYHENRRGFLRFSTSALLAAPLLRTSPADGAEPANTPNESNMPANLDSVKALTFDVFGTVVDWRSSIIREGRELAARGRCSRFQAVRAGPKTQDCDWSRNGVLAGCGHSRSRSVRPAENGRLTVSKSQST